MNSVELHQKAVELVEKTLEEHRALGMSFEDTFTVLLVAAIEVHVAVAQGDKVLCPRALYGLARVMRNNYEAIWALRERQPVFEVTPLPKGSA